MNDKKAQRHGAAHDSEIRFGGIDAAGHGRAERGDYTTHRDIREESSQSAALYPQTAAPAHTADGRNEMLRCGRAGSRAATRDGTAQDMSESSLYPRGTAHSSCSTACTSQSVANTSLSRGSVRTSRAQSSTHPSRTADRQNGSRGTCARIAAPICAAVCALSLIHFSFSSGDIRPAGGLSSDYIPAAITFTPPQKLEPKGFWDYFSEAMAEFFGLYER